MMAIRRRGFCRRVTSRSYLSKPAAAELLLVVLAPNPHCVENGPERLSQVGERVLHPWGHLCERLTMSESSRRMSTCHLLPMSKSVVSTGQAGRFSKVGAVIFAKPPSAIMHVIYISFLLVLTAL